MIPKSDNRERLLAETFHGDWSSGNAARFAANAARSARRRRIARVALKTSALACLAIGVVVAISSHRDHTRAARTSLPPAATTAAGYEIISDTELLTLVQDRPLLVVQSDTATGRPRQIIIFGQ
jgi:hydroxypyruvate isomerase